MKERGGGNGSDRPRWAGDGLLEIWGAQSCWLIWSVCSFLDGHNSSCAGCGLQVRAQAQAHRTTWHLAPTLAPALYTGHFPVRVTGDGQPADQPWKSPSCPRHPRPQNLPSSSGEQQARPPSPQAAHAWASTEVIHSVACPPARLPGLIALFQPNPAQPGPLSSLPQPTAKRCTSSAAAAAAASAALATLHCCAPAPACKAYENLGQKGLLFSLLNSVPNPKPKRCERPSEFGLPAPPVVNRLHLRAPLPAPAPAPAPSSASASASTSASASVELAFHLCQQHAATTSCSMPSHPAPPGVLLHLHCFLRS